MRIHRVAVALAGLLHACAVLQVERPIQPTPRWLARCRPSGPTGLACRARAWREVALPFDVQQLAPRRSGGAYVLGPSGELARVDAAGRLTGVFQTPLSSLAVTHDYVCGAEPSGRVMCARDHHHDLSCSAAELAPWLEMELPHWPGAQLISTRTGDALCLRRDGAQVCVPGTTPCERSCLAFPACAPLRCLDPCPVERSS